MHTKPPPHTQLWGILHTQSGTNRPKTHNVREPTHTPTSTQCFEFHFPRKAPKTPFLNSPLQKQSQESNPQSQDLLSFASKCKWKSLFYKRLIEQLGEEAVAAHQFSRWMPDRNFICCRSPRRSCDALISHPAGKWFKDDQESFEAAPHFICHSYKVDPLLTSHALKAMQSVQGGVQRSNDAWLKKKTTKTEPLPSDMAFKWLTGSQTTIWTWVQGTEKRNVHIFLQDLLKSFDANSSLLHESQTCYTPIHSPVSSLPT